MKNLFTFTFLVALIIFTTFSTVKTDKARKMVLAGLKKTETKCPSPPLQCSGALCNTCFCDDTGTPICID